MKIINTVLQWLKPLPIGIFKNEAHVKEILNICIKNFNPDAKIGEIFLVDIELPLVMMLVKFILVFLNQKKKKKKSTDWRSVYQLLSTMPMGEKKIFKSLRQQKKTHSTLFPKKRFPMYIF